MEDNINKKIDEGWKEAAEKEKKSEPGAQEPQMPPASFYTLVTSLSIQAMMFLGEIENPMTGKKERDLDQAKYLIDLLDMIKEKTKNNLSQDEQQMLESALYELKIKYAQAT